MSAAAAGAIAPVAEALPAPPRVLFVSGEYPPMRGGVGDYTNCLSRALAQIGASTWVVTSRVAQLRGERAPLSPTVLAAMPSWGWRDLPLLLRVVDDVRADVVHIQYQTGAFGMGLAPNLLLPVLARRATRPLLAVTFHDLKEPYLFPKARAVRRWANQALRRSADLVYATNGQDLTALGGQARVLPIGSNIAAAPLGPGDRAAIRIALGAEDDDFALGFFGFPDPWKGVDTLVDAANRLWRDGRRLKLVFVGGVRHVPSGQESPIPRDPRVVATGFAPPDQTSARLQALDAIALPFAGGACYRHGSLIAAIEHGLPIVSTRTTLAERAVDAHGIEPLIDGENARLVEPGDAAALASAIAELIDRPDLRARLAGGARRLRPQFGWDRIARASLAAYQELRAAGR